MYEFNDIRVVHDRTLSGHLFSARFFISISTCGISILAAVTLFVFIVWFSLGTHDYVMQCVVS